MKDLCTFKLQILTLTCNLPLTCYLPSHSASSVPDSSKTSQIFKFLLMLQSHPINKNLTLQSHISIQHQHSDLFSYTSKKKIPPLPSGLLTHHIKPSHLHTRGHVIFTLSHPHFDLFYYCIYIHIEEPRGHDTTLSHTTTDPEVLTLLPFYPYTS